MRISLNWLKDFIKIDVPASELADKLTNVGFEVEEIIQLDKHLENVIVGKITKIERHPDADKLVVCAVDIGDRTTQIVTAATNVFEGALVPVAMPGADLANGIKIKASRLRGVESEGMFCSGEELGFGDGFYEGASVNGILIFKDDFKPGTSVAKCLMLNDTVLDVSITANRPDCMSVIGIAREISAIYKTPIILQDLSYKTVGGNVKEELNVDVKDFQLCPRYTAAVIKNIKIDKSPLFMRARLMAAGIHPINNIVDITNYVLIECGQPMHAFDKKYIEENKIVVRSAKKGEKLAVLNGSDYELDENNLIIADGKNPMVIAGVIGGVNSSINESTKQSVFEAAVFERTSIRRTNRQFGVRTDSSARFEKGVDLGSPMYGMKRALHLVSKLGCGDIIEGIIDAKNKEIENRIVVASKEKIDKILGVKIPLKDCIEIMNNLGIKTVAKGDEIICDVPPYRFDVECDADIAEEIIRMFGYGIYDGIKQEVMANCQYAPGKHDKILTLQNNFKNILVEKGFFEILSYSFYSPKTSDKLNLKKESALRKTIKLANPISEDLSDMRTTMAGSLLDNIEFNVKHGNREVKIMEVGKVFFAEKLPLEKLPEEKNVLAFASTLEEDDFYTFKGCIESLFTNLNVELELKRSECEFLHPGVSAEIINKATGEKLAMWGKINPKVCANFEIGDNTFYAEIDCDLVSKLNSKNVVVKPISKYPLVSRDLALMADENITNLEIETIIKQCCGNDFYSVKLFDIYRNKALGDKKSLAYNIKLSSQEKTLTDEEVNAIINKILKRLNQVLGVELRK